MQMEIVEAKAKLSKLIAAAENGERVIIARSGVPIVEIVLVRPRTLLLGLLKEKVAKESIPDFFKPMDEAELADWGE